jgi:hypothetical protein
MNKQARTKKRLSWRRVLSWLRLAAGNIQKKAAIKGKSFEAFPNEAPH